MYLCFSIYTYTSRYTYFSGGFFTYFIFFPSKELKNNICWLFHNFQSLLAMIEAISLPLSHAGEKLWLPDTTHCCGTPQSTAGGFRLCSYRMNGPSFPLGWMIFHQALQILSGNFNSSRILYQSTESKELYNEKILSLQVFYSRFFSAEMGSTLLLWTVLLNITSSQAEYMIAFYSYWETFE